MSESSPPNLNSKYAWREVAGQGLPQRSAPERAADFREIYGLYDEATAQAQASRCLQCPDPNCVSGCPLCNPVPQWMQLTAEGRFQEAAALLGNANNLAEICARLCPSERLCEGKCLLDAVSEPVAIRALEQFLMEYAFAHGLVDASTAPPNGLKVAVVGSGPGALACGDDLARQGYAVTLYDTALVPGGLLVNGVPAFKLEQSVVQRRVALLQQRGVVFRLGAKLWEEITVERLRAEHDAVYLGFDSRKPRPLDLPGAGLEGVVQAVPFLLQKQTTLPLQTPSFAVAGKRVVVLGDGDMAMDCLRTAIRHGAREAVCLCRGEEADLACHRVEYEHARTEGARFLFQVSPVGVLGNPAGRVCGLRLSPTERVPGEDGQSFRPQPGKEFDVEVDWIVAALGFEPLACPQPDALSGLTLNEQGGLVVDGNLMTSLPGVFAGGDPVRGPSSVLQTVRDGRLAAARINSYLLGAKAG